MSYLRDHTCKGRKASAVGVEMCVRECIFVEFVFLVSFPYLCVNQVVFNFSISFLCVREEKL